MTCSKRHILRKTAALLAGCFILFLLPFGVARGSEPTTMLQADRRDQTVRVYLSRIGITDRMDITLTAPYLLTLDGSSMRFSTGSELAILLKNDDLYVYYEGMSINAGKTLTLSRYAGSFTENGFRLTNYPALYEGDLSLSIVEDKIRPILAIHVEDYLLGVVPYEMNNSFPLEALKAQAIAARTYALRKQNPNAAYDVVDTTNDQVFRGYQPGSALVEEAIRATRGICGFYKGKLAQCYYAASNGGQMELVQDVWPTDEDFSYYTFGDDPYDVENPMSVVRSITMQKKYLEDETALYAIRKLLATELSQELTKRGYDPAPESVQVNEVSALSIDTPKGAEGSKLMTMLHMTVKISGRTRTDSFDAPVQTPAPQAQPTQLDLDTEEVSIFSAMQNATPAPTSTLALTPSPTPAPEYGPFTSIDEAFTLDLAIFPTVERAYSLDISSNYDNELWSVKETEKEYTIEARRFGHGIGMSQRGAQWMATKYDKTYADILAFYYPGLELMQYPENDIVLLAEEVALAETAGPAPTPTPRPTLMPATLEAGEGQWYALVTGIEDDSSLNLRATPEANGDILLRLYKNQRLLVLEQCPEEGWVKVQTDVITGYVVERFLTKEE